MDEKLKKIIFIVLGCFVILFLFLFMMSSCSSKYSPSKLEKEIIKNAKVYYKSHKDELPKENAVTTISLADLVNFAIFAHIFVN